MISHPTSYIVNSNALGDICASLPVLKHLIDTYHIDGKYKIVALPIFRDLFYFVPDCNFFDINKKVDFEEDYLQFKLNILEQDRVKTFTFPDGSSQSFNVIPQYNIPLRMHLTHYASIQFSNRVLPLEEMNYLQYPLDRSLIEHFNIDFSKCVAINPVFRSKTRRFSTKALTEICNYIKSKGYFPLFLGRDNIDYDDKDKLASTIDFDFSCGINLINKTSIKECINIISQCRTILGIDNGMLHLSAMCGDLPIIAGYTMCSPEIRLPVRHNQLGWNVHSVVPNKNCCRYCQDTWQCENHDFNWCYYGDYKCTEAMTAKKFIKHLEKIL